MHIDYQISQQDYIAAQHLALKKMRPSMARFLAFGPWFGLFLLVFIAQAVFKRGFSSNFIPALAVPLFFLIVPITTRRSILTSYAKSTNMHGPLTLDVDEDWLSFRGQTFSSEVSWDHFASFYEDRKSFVISQRGQTVFNILPKRCLSPEQTSTLRDLLSRHINTGASAVKHSALR